MTRYIFGPRRFAILIATGIAAAARQLGSAVFALGQPAVKPLLQQENSGSGSRRYTFEAVVTLPAAAAESGMSLPGPDWHGVIRAETGAGHSGGLFSALVSGWEPHAGGPAGSSQAVATITAFGPEPADCLPTGEPFVLWRGQEVGHGVVTRRKFV